MITLGINAAFHDSSAAIVVDGEVVAAAEEERFTRIKHAKRPVPFSAWELPFHAIDYCLAEAGTALADLDNVAYSFDPEALPGADAEEAGGPPAGQEPAAVQRWDALFATYMRHAPLQLADGVPHHLRGRLAKRGLKWRWHFVNHHLAHQASAFLAAPYDQCAVMTLDGRGERATTGYGVYADNVYRSLGEVHVPHSLGLLYERVTTHLGFLHSSDEYKVMALAALGHARFRERLARCVQVTGDGQYTVAPLDLHTLFGPPRLAGEPLEERHLDLAASLQDLLEDTVVRLARWLRKASGQKHLAMAGGVALNCVLNSRLRDSGIFDGIWVQPAAGDAGTSLGAALWVDGLERREAAHAPVAERPRTCLPPLPAGAVLAGDPSERLPGRPMPPMSLAPRRWRMNHAYLGPGFDDAAIEDFLRRAKLAYRRLVDADGRDVTAPVTAERLAQGAIVGWFQGRMEFGPRALGARSILASPIDPAMQSRLNELKDREDFRPVAPAVPEEELAAWFERPQANGGRSPFMLFVYDLKPAQAAHIPAACHTDHTARVQTVDAHSQPRFHALLRAFGDRTGVPVLVNTSFNVRGQPIVCTPGDAIEAFYTTPLDALVIGSFLLEKRA